MSEDRGVLRQKQDEQNPIYKPNNSSASINAGNESNPACDGYGCPLNIPAPENTGGDWHLGGRSDPPISRKISVLREKDLNGIPMLSSETTESMNARKNLDRGAS